MILEMYKTDRIGDVFVDLLRVCFCDIVKQLLVVYQRGGRIVVH